MSGWHDPQPFQHLGLSLPSLCRDMRCEQRGLRQQVSRRGHGRALQLPHGLHAPARQEDVQRWVRVGGCHRAPPVPQTPCPPTPAPGIQDAQVPLCPLCGQLQHRVLLGDRHCASPHAPSDTPSSHLCTGSSRAHTLGSPRPPQTCRPGPGDAVTPALARACIVSFGSSRSSTPVPPRAACLPADCFQNPRPAALSEHPPLPQLCRFQEHAITWSHVPCVWGFYCGCGRVYSSLPCSRKRKVPAQERQSRRSSAGAGGMGRWPPCPALLPFYRSFPSSKFCD